MLGWDPQSPVPINDRGDTVPIVEALTSHFEFTKLTLPLLKNADIYFDNEELSERIQDESWAREYVINRDFIDLITDFPTIELQPENMYQILRKLPPREYSISSSFMATPDEVHITVGTVRYQAHGRERKGVCSVHFAEPIKKTRRYNTNLFEEKSELQISDEARYTGYYDWTRYWNCSF